MSSFSARKKIVIGRRKENENGIEIRVISANQVDVLLTISLRLKFGYPNHCSALQRSEIRLHRSTISSLRLRIAHRARRMDRYSLSNKYGVTVESQTRLSKNLYMIHGMID